MSQIYWQYIGIFSTVLAAVLLFFALWGRRELRRSRAMELHAQLVSWGFTQLARLMKAYTIGNYIGANSVTRVSREVIESLLDHGLPEELRRIGWKVVEGVFLKNADDRAKLTKMLAETRADIPLEAPAKTPTVAT